MRRINPRRAKLHRSFSVVELADVLGVHKNTVRNWLREGLPQIDGVRPVLILGGDFQEWWGKKCKAAKRPLKPGQLYCLKCRHPRAPALGMVEYSARTAATGNLKALCETCGTMMHRRARLTSLTAIMPGLEVTQTKAASSIGEREEPSLICYNSRGS